LSCTQIALKGHYFHSQ